MNLKILLNNLLKHIFGQSDTSVIVLHGYDELCWNMQTESYTDVVLDQLHFNAKLVTK